MQLKAVQLQWKSTADMRLLRLPEASVSTSVPLLWALIVDLLVPLFSNLQLLVHIFDICAETNFSLPKRVNNHRQGIPLLQQILVEWHSSNFCSICVSIVFGTDFGRNILLLTANRASTCRQIILHGLSDCLWIFALISYWILWQFLMHHSFICKKCLSNFERVL